MRNHGVPVTVSESETPIPLHFAFLEGTHVDGIVAEQHQAADPRRVRRAGPQRHRRSDRQRHLRSARAAEPMPLAPFTAQRIDYSLHRLSHYTATSPSHFQNFVLFTNYQFYIDEFCVHARDLMAKGGDGYTAFVEPGNVIIKRGEDAPQRRRCDAASAADAGLSSDEARPWRHHHGQYRRRASPTPRRSPTISPC